MNSSEKFSKCNLIFPSYLPGLKKGYLESKNFLNDDFKKELLKKKVLEICIGMQILFGSSEEGKKKGLNLP